MANMVKEYFIILTFIFINSTAFPLSNTQAEPPNQCSTNCITPFGTKLGESFGVPAYSNCQSLCIRNKSFTLPKEETGLQENVYTGMSWQCVEYARRWLIKNKHIAFGSINYAYEIWDLPNITNLNDNKKIKFENFENGESKNPPQVGDLIIYNKSKTLPYGHVAVVVDVNLNAGYADLAEENYENKTWDNPEKYARKLKLMIKNGEYTLTNVRFEDKVINNEEEENIIGWKRAIINK